MLKTKIYFICLATLVVLAPGLARAAQAGIVIKKQDGTVKTSCVSFEGDTISGLELLERSGWSVVSNRGFVIGIDGEGDKDSFQITKNDPSWSYWRLMDGAWYFQGVGASYSRVTSGVVEGWEFSLKRSYSSLPQTTFEQICPSAPVSEATTQNRAAVQSVAPAEASSERVTGQSGRNDSATVQDETDTIPSSAEGDNSALAQSEVKGVADENRLSSWPKFNLTNFLILFFIFVCLGVGSVLLKKRISCNRRKNM